MKTDRPTLEALSQLAAGDLSEAEARALTRRIEAEPDTAEAWSALTDLVHDLEAIPEPPPPPELDRAVLGSGPPAANRTPLRRAAFAVAITSALAAAALATIRAVDAFDRSAPGRVTLVAGTQWVQGEAMVAAGEVEVRVSGIAQITVEPTAGVLREPPTIRATGSEPEGSMDSKVAIGAGIGGVIAGALVTVAVYEGTAEVDTRDGAVVVQAGDTRRFEPAGAASARAKAGGDAVVATTPQARISQLEAENEALKEKLAEAEFTGAVARGQVAATQGEPVPWTDDIPAAFRPAAFEALVKEQVASVDGFEIEAIDCSEFPCVTTIVGPAGDGWQAQAKALAEGISTGLGEDVGTWMGLSIAQTDEGTTGGIGLAFAPPDDMGDDSIRTRLDYRAQSMLHDLEPEHDGPGTHDEEVGTLDVLDGLEALLEPKK